MKKNIRLLICLVIVTLMLMDTNCFAAWWGTPGYEWALSKDLTSMKTQAQLNRDVTLSDYYNIILKYLRMKNVAPSGRVVQNLYVDGIYNGTINGLVKDINSNIGTNITSLSPQQYRVVADLIDHGKKQIVDYSAYLYRDDLKNLNLYFDLAKYRAAKLLSENSKIEKQYKNDVLWSLRNTKYAVSIEYGILPMCGSDITRESFLVLMHHLLSNSSATTSSILKSFNDADVLRGVNIFYYDPKPKKNMTYSEMFAFLYRFEAYDFSSSTTKIEQPSGENN